MMSLSYTAVVRNIGRYCTTSTAVGQDIFELRKRARRKASWDLQENKKNRESLSWSYIPEIDVGRTILE